MSIELSTLIPPVVGFLGVLVGASAARLTSISTARVSRTLDLHREYYAERLSKARSEAFQFLKRNWGKSFADIDEDETLEPLATPLWDVLYFYVRLSTLVRHRQLVRSMVPDLFGNEFAWWYVVVFRQGLASSQWQSAHEIRHLLQWMAANADRVKWSNWIAQHEVEYKALAARLPAAPPNPSVKGTSCGKPQAAPYLER
jgi:hypothetical protein